MNAVERFANTIDFDDFSNHSILNEYFQKTFNVTSEELEALNAKEQQEKILDKMAPVSLDNMEKYLEFLNKISQNESLIQKKYSANLQRGADMIIKKLSQNRNGDRNVIMKPIFKWYCSKIGQTSRDFSSKMDDMKSKGIIYDKIFCPICNCYHVVECSSIGESEMATHQEIAFKDLLNMFYGSQEIFRLGIEMYSNLKKMNKEFLFVRSVDKLLMKTLNSTCLEITIFIAEVAVGLLKQLNSSTKQLQHRILISKYIYEIIEFITSTPFLNIIMRELGTLRKIVNDYLFMLFERMQSEISEEECILECLETGNIPKKYIIDMNHKIDLFRKEISEFKDSFIDLYCERIKEIVNGYCSNRFNSLFEFLLKEFTDDCKLYFLKLFNEDVWNRYRKDSQLDIDDKVIFEKGKSFETIVDRIVELNGIIIKSHIDEVDVNFENQFPSNVFTFTGTKFIGDYNYTKEDDPLMYSCLKDFRQFKADLFKAWTSIDEDFMIPRAYNENYSLMSSLKTDDDWLKHFNPKTFFDIRYGIYFYFRNNRSLASSLVRKSRMPDLSVIPKSKLKTIKQIFNVDENELLKYMYSIINC